MRRRKFLQTATQAAAIVPFSANVLFDEKTIAEHANGKVFSPESFQDISVAQKELENSTRLLRAKLLNDPLRPTYHFVSPEGYAMPFDPNGAIYWKGKYHLGYIFQHNNEHGERIHYWGHVSSSDLFHWSILPPMLDVKEGDPETGIFSGGAFLSKEGVPHVIYHGTQSGNCIAKAKDDDLITWVKFKENPILPIKDNKDLTERQASNEYNAWDPYCWLEGDIYYQISGGNPAALLKSKDLLNWDYIGDFIDQSKRMRYDFEDWSCPDFFKIDDKYVAIAISHNLGTQYYIGDFVNEQFIPEKHERMNWPGGTFFAPETLLDDKGRRILWGWVLDRREYSDSNGWSGTMSLPRVLSLSDTGDVLITPPEEVKALRYDERIVDDFIMEGNKERALNTLKGNTIELQVEIIAEGKDSYGLKVLCSPDGREETIIKYVPSSNELVIDYLNSAYPGNVKFESYCMKGHLLKTVPEYVSEQRVPFELKNGDPLKLNIFIDKSIIEVFANGLQCVTQRVYPVLKDSNGVRIFNEGKRIEVKNMKCWQMRKTNFY